MRIRIFKVKYIYLLVLFLLINCTNKNRQANILTKHLFVISKSIDSVRVNINNNNLIDNITLFTPYYSSPKENKSFVSVSDIYRFSDNDISKTMPDLAKLSVENRERIALTSDYRKNLLDSTEILETDSIYVYYYELNILKTYLVKDLDAVAILTPYASPEDKNLQEYDYMLGFEYPKRSEEKEWENMIVYIGRNNPFAQEQLIPINWKEIAPDDFPQSIIMPQNDLDSKKIYLYQVNGLKYYIIDSGSWETRLSRYLVILDYKTNKPLLNMQFGYSEGSSPTPINDFKDKDINQWAGKLLKNYPPVIFGLEYQSFGCPLIIITDNPIKYIYLNCDNRH